MSKPFPPEILSLLFTHCISSTTKSWGFFNHQHNRRPLLHLASVCREWREVACTTSELWTTCWLSYSHPEFNVLWLSRTGSRLFDIIGLPASLVGSGTIVNQAVLSIIPSMQRCRSLSIGYDSNSYSNIDDDVQDTPIADFSAPNLISCELRGTDVPLWFYQSLSHSSELQKLEVDNYSPLLIPVFASLSSLRIANSEEGIPLQVILANAQQLHTLEISECYILESAQTIQATPIVNEALVNLHLSFLASSGGGTIFGQLTLPSLKALHLDGELLEGWVEQDTLSFHAFLERSQCRLESFTSASFEPLWLTSLLRHDLVSFLGLLESSILDITPEYLRFLADPTKLPNLRILKLVGAEILKQESFSLLVDMVSARRTPIGGQDRPNGSRLKYFELELKEYFMSKNYHLRPVYAPQERRIKAIASASEGDADPLVVCLQDWRSGRIVEGSDEEADGYEGIRTISFVEAMRMGVIPQPQYTQTVESS